MHCACMLHSRSFYASAIRSERINSKENGCDVLANIPAFQIKKRSSRRNTAVISDKTPKPNVSSLYEELELLPCLVSEGKWEETYV